jgi:hypothetical protein
MVIEIDLRVTPPAVALREPDDFGGFKIVGLGRKSDREQLAHELWRIGRVSEDGHVFIAADTLLTIAGDRAREREWLVLLDGMHAYARARGWTDSTGAIRGHVEWSAYDDRA